MAFTGSIICTSFYTGLLNGVHNFGANTFRVALYNSTATLDENTTAYTTTGELATGSGYTAGGTIVAATVSTVQTSNGKVVLVDFADASWAASTLTARGAMLYDDTPAGNPAVAIMDFGSNKISAASTFLVSFPSPTANEAFIQFATVLGQ